MCYVIVTCRAFLWTICTLLSTFLIFAAVITPQWLVGPEPLSAPATATTQQVAYLGDKESYGDSYATGSRDATVATDWGKQKRTLGLFNSCTKVNSFEGMVDMYMERFRFRYASGEDDAAFTCSSFIDWQLVGEGEVALWDQLNAFWLSSLVLFALGLLLCLFTMLTSILSYCVHSMCGKSIFTVSGLLQAIAGLLYVIALILYPAGWESDRAMELCGKQTSAYLIDDCELGWAFYLALAGTLLTFLCSLLSIQADVSTSNDKVQEEIYKGKVCICLA